MIKTKVAFWRAAFYPTNQSNLKNIKKALIGWKKAGLPKKPLCFDHVNRLHVNQLNETNKQNRHTDKSYKFFNKMQG